MSQSSLRFSVKYQLALLRLLVGTQMFHNKKKSSFRQKELMKVIAEREKTALTRIQKAINLRGSTQD